MRAPSWRIGISNRNGGKKEKGGQLQPQVAPKNELLHASGEENTGEMKRD